MIRRRLMLLAGQEEEMKEWKLLQQVTLEEPQNVAFEIAGIYCTEFYIFANAGLTEQGNTSVTINDGETGCFTNISKVGEKRYNTIHGIAVGTNYMLEEIEDYSLQGFITTRMYACHPKLISGTHITSIQLIRNSENNTFIAGSEFEIWGR